MNKVQVQKSGSWTVFWLLVIFFFPAAIFYYLFKIKKTRVYEK